MGGDQIGIAFQRQGGIAAGLGKIAQSEIGFGQSQIGFGFPIHGREGRLLEEPQRLGRFADGEVDASEQQVDLGGSVGVTGIELLEDSNRLLELFGVDQAPSQFHGGDGFGLRSSKGNSTQGKNANRQPDRLPCEEHTHTPVWIDPPHETIAWVVR
ncbi:protein of unknown function [Magnetospirillum sp. XM-1]|nr:protein of unknown function [Magnetospirillum sp. XM-1]